MQGITIGLQFFGIWNVFQATLSSLDIFLMKSQFPFSMTARELKHYGLHWMKVNQSCLCIESSIKKKKKKKPEQQGLDSWFRAHGDAGKRHRETREACAPPAYLPHTDLLSGVSELYLFIINW